MASPPPVTEDQNRLLEEALGVVRQQSSLMRKCLEFLESSWMRSSAGELPPPARQRPQMVRKELSANSLVFLLLQLDSSLGTSNKQPGPEAVLRALHGRLRRPATPLRPT